MRCLCLVWRSSHDPPLSHTERESDGGGRREEGGSSVQDGGLTAQTVITPPVSCLSPPAQHGRGGDLPNFTMGIINWKLQKV